MPTLHPDRCCSAHGHGHTVRNCWLFGRGRTFWCVKLLVKCSSSAWHGETSDLDDTSCGLWPSGRPGLVREWGADSASEVSGKGGMTYDSNPVPFHFCGEGGHDNQAWYIYGSNSDRMLHLVTVAPCLLEQQYEMLEWPVCDCVTTMTWTGPYFPLPTDCHLFSVY